METLYEGSITVTSATNLLTNDKFGADTPVTKTVTSVEWTNDGGTNWVAGTLGGAGFDARYGHLTVTSLGVVTYISNLSVAHSGSGSVDDLFRYTITDTDGDTSTAQASVKVRDKGVAIETPDPPPTLDESSLSSGDTSCITPITVYSTAYTYVGDPIDLRFNYNSALQFATMRINSVDINDTTTFADLTSNGNPLNYYLVPDALVPIVFHQIIAYAGGEVVGLPSDEKRVFTLTINNTTTQPTSTSLPTLTFTLHQQIDKYEILDFSNIGSTTTVNGLRVDEIVTGASNNSATASFSIVANDDPIPYVTPDGTDNILNYDGYADVNHTNGGYDALVGNDTLVLWNEGCIDFAVDRHIANIEVIDLTKNGNHSLWNISADDVSAMTDGGTKLLTILGDTSDNVSFIGGVWTKNAPVVVGYDRYTNSINSYMVDVALNINDTYS